MNRSLERITIGLLANSLQLVCTSCARNNDGGISTMQNCTQSLLKTLSSILNWIFCCGILNENWPFEYEWAVGPPFESNGLTWKSLTLKPFEIIYLKLTMVSVRLTGGIVSIQLVRSVLSPGDDSTRLECSFKGSTLEQISVTMLTSRQVNQFFVIILRTQCNIYTKFKVENGTTVLK